VTLDPARLRDRLRSIVSPSGQKRSAAGVPAEAASAPAEAETADTPAPYSSLESSLGGAWREHDGARSFVITRRVEPDARYGHVRVGDIGHRMRSASAGLSMLATGSPQAPHVFFDLETTGLSGGAGTHAFLVGCGWFDEQGGFVTEQHLMTDFASERAMLTVVAGELARAGALVTFNGKSFDAPVLETRYLFHRLTSPCSALSHVDVLHPSRRFWGMTAEGGCSLMTLEQRLLGAQRQGDVPGSEIPARYFQYVRTGDARPLGDVFEHNRLDLLSLAGVTARLLQLIADGAAATRDPHEALALGRVYERAGHTHRAEQAFESAVELAAHARRGFSGNRGADYRSTAHGASVEALRALALIARRDRRFADAAERWTQVLRVQGCPTHIAREATEALAIHHEHRERDLAAAKRFALLSLEAGSEAAWGDAVRHRLARIERKMVSEKPLFPSSPLQPSCDSPTSGRRTSS